MSGTGEGKRQLVEGIRTDLTRVRRECESLAHECEKIHDEAKGLNGWPAVWKGVSQLLAQAAVQLREAERSDLPKLQGSLHARIISDLNEAQADAVKTVRMLGEGQGTAGGSESLPAAAANGASSGEERSAERNGDHSSGGQDREDGDGAGGSPWANPSSNGTRLLAPT